MSSQRVQVGRDVAGLGFGQAQVGHRRAGVGLLRKPQPRDHAGRRIRHHAAQVCALADAVQRRADESACPRCALHVVTTAAAIGGGERAAAVRVALQRGRPVGRVARAAGGQQRERERAAQPPPRRGPGRPLSRRSRRRLDWHNHFSIRYRPMAMNTTPEGTHMIRPPTCWSCAALRPQAGAVAA